LPEGRINKKEKVAIIEADLARVVAHHLTRKVNTNIESDSDSDSDEEDIVEIIGHESDSESEEEEGDIDILNTSTKDSDKNVVEQLTFSRSGRRQGNYLTQKWFWDYRIIYVYMVNKFNI
jgi:signal recognition particle GTPase